MNLQFYLEKLFTSEKFQEFIKENPNAYFCSGFFSLDKEGKDSKAHIDYFIPDTKKIFSFKLEKGIEIVLVDSDANKVLEKVSDNLDFDFGKIEEMIVEKMAKEGMKNKIQKILLSLQNLNGNNFLIGTIFISGLGMIKIRIDLKNMKIIEFDKKSFLDMMKIVKK